MIKLLTRLKTLMFICVLLAFIGPFFVNKISSNVGIAWQLDYVSAFVTALAFTSIPLAILQWLALQVPDDQATLNWITLIFSILGSALYIFIAIVLFIPAINNHLPSTFSTDLGLAFIGLALYLLFGFDTLVRNRKLLDCEKIYHNITNRWNLKFIRITQILLWPLTFILLIAHLFKWAVLKIDAITLLLVGILLFIPMIELIRKIKWGDFEAEIEPDEIAKAKAAMAIDLPTSASESTETRIRELLSEDPQLALARVRIDLEQALKRLYSSTSEPKSNWHKFSLGRIIENLVRSEILPTGMANALREVISLANRAIHGESVELNAAEELAILGVRLAEEVQSLYAERILKPVERREVSKQEVELYLSHTYRVRTIIPLVENPYSKTYIFDQDALDAFLDGYEKFAEFIVEIEPLPLAKSS